MRVLLLSLTLFFPLPAIGALVNLGFDDAPLGGLLDQSFIAAAELVLPGWVTSTGDKIGVNGGALEGSFISVWVPEKKGPIAAAEGSVYVLLEKSNAIGTIPTSIAQRGIFPSNTLALEFYGIIRPAANVMVDGEILELTTLGSKAASATTNWTLYGADIRRFAGGEHELRFSAPPAEFGAKFFIDGISFTDRLIPEPSTALLVLAAGLLVLGSRHRNRNCPAG